MKNNNLRAILAKNLSVYAARNGKKQADLCNDTLILHSTMSQYFSGKRFPCDDHLQRISECLNVPIPKLLDGNLYPYSTVDSLPDNVRVLVCIALRLEPNQLGELLRYCSYMYPDAVNEASNDIAVNAANERS